MLLRRGGSHKNFFGGCSEFQKITNCNAKIALLGNLREKKICWREPAKFFLRGQIFKDFFQKKENVVRQKSKIQRGGQKALLEGVGSI